MTSYKIIQIWYNIVTGGGITSHQMKGVLYMTYTSLFITLAVIFIVFPICIVFGIVELVNSKKKAAQPREIVYGPQYRAPKPPKDKMSASSVMLIIGTIFVMLSSITFVAANWLNMEPITRVLALAGSAVIAFVICGVLKAVSELVQTSSAFYMIGSLISIVSVGTAGYYKFFGEWLSFDGLGNEMFCAILAALAAVSGFVGQNFYKHSSFYYTGFSFISIAIGFLCGQFANEYSQYVLFISLAQVIITAVLHISKPQKGMPFEKPAEVIGDITAVIYQLIAMTGVVETTFDATWYTFVLLGILFVQLFGYGLLKNQKWMFIFGDIAGFYMAIAVLLGFNNDSSEPWRMLLFGVITFAVYLLNCFIPENLTSSRVISLIGFVGGALIALSSETDKVYGLNLILPFILTLVIMSYCLHRSSDIQFVSGLALPLIPFCMACNINNNIYSINLGADKLNVIIYGILALVYVLMTLFFVKLPKISFALHIKHPVKAHTAEYTLMTAAAFLLLSISDYVVLLYPVVLIVVLHFIVSYTMKCNITAAGSVIAFILMLKKIISVNIQSENVKDVMLFSLFILLIIASRFLFSESIIYKKNDRLSVDVLLPASIFSLIGISLVGKISSFLIFIAIAVFIAAFIKKNTDKQIAAVILSVSAFFVFYALITRQFLTFETDYIASKVNLGFLLLLGIAYKYIWRNNQQFSRVISMIVFVCAFVGLIFDGICHDNMFNRIFVLAVTAAVLIFSFYAKSKTWFSVSSISLVVLTVLLTGKYFESAGWWVYLLAVGVIFIAIAAFNEAVRKKGETMKDTVTKTFSDWTW